MRNRFGKQTGALWIAASLWAACGGSSNAPTGMSQAPNGSDPSAANSGTSPGSSAGPATPGSSSPAGAQPPTPGGSDSPAQAPVTGATDFVSADLGQQSSGSKASAGAADNAATVPAPQAPAAVSGAVGTASTREVDRGDVYAVLPDHRILNLNAYRGVQVIDISALDQPKIEGRLAVAGTPVEMYVVGDRAFVLLNDWQGYYRVDDGAQVDTESGGLVLSVDIHNRANPTLIAQANVPGQIVTSRLTQGTGQVALYVAATNYNASAEAVVKSFDVSDGKLTPKSELNLGGYINDIQATTDVLMVSAQDPSSSDGRSIVSVIDISKPDGTMVRGGSVVAAGMVQNKFNMDAYKGVLRVVSGAAWSANQQNQVETFDLHDLNNLKPLARCNLTGHNLSNGESEQLYATLFVGNDAFFVTYYRKDPFHAFSIDDQGQCVEHSEFVVSGWNDFLRATLDDTRLIGIGHNDQNNTQTLSVSLYDASNLSNPNPLEARADIDLSYSYSQASWDDRAFTVLNDAVSVAASDGTIETGVVLLPYDGWDANGHNIDQVQIFTFSDHTLTKRGVMDHGSSVQRSFDATTATANLSDDALSLFDTSNPDSPKELGRVDVAPDYRQVFVYGDYVARVKNNGANLSYGTSDQAPPDSVQIVARSGDVDADAPLVSFDVPGGANLIQVGSLLVSVLTSADPNTNSQTQTYTSKIQVFDLSDPTKPSPRGSLQTDRLQPNGGLYYPVDNIAPTPAIPVPGGAIGVGGCFDCFRPYNAQVPSYVLGSAIAFVNTLSQQKSLGTVHECDTYAPPVACSSGKGGNTVCGGITPGSSSSYYSGGITCTTPPGGTQSCSGSFQLCDSSGSCQPSATPPGAMSSCSDYEQFRYWTSYAFDPLDLRDPDHPALAPRLSLPPDEEGTSLLAANATLYFNYQQPITMSGDARSYVKHFVRLLDFSDPSAPLSGDPINIPGDVIAADSSIYTRDFVWNQNDARTLVARLTLSGGLAHLQASRLFADREVSAVVLDQASHVLVSSDPAYGVAMTGLAVPPPSAAVPSGTSASPPSTAPTAPITPPVQMLNILDAQSLADVGEADVAQWATLKGAEQGRALFQVSGGLLVFDVRDATKPTAQAYFPNQGWPDDIYFDGQDILFAADRYGVYRFDASTQNLMTMP
jgi:hypothetical protein